MPAYNFQSRFAADVKSGRKCQTIRQNRKRNPHSGDTLYLYTGQRTKNCRKLLQAECTDVLPIVISDWFIEVNGVRLSIEEKQELARRDGFKSVGEFVFFFMETYGLDFEGVIIRWRPPNNGLQPTARRLDGSTELAEV